MLTRIVNAIGACLIVGKYILAGMIAASAILTAS